MKIYFPHKAIINSLINILTFSHINFIEHNLSLVYIIKISTLNRNSLTINIYIYINDKI